MSGCCKSKTAEAVEPVTPAPMGEKTVFFGGCGCLSPYAYQLPDGNIVLEYPDHPEKGALTLTTRQLTDLGSMIHEARHEGRLPK